MSTSNAPILPRHEQAALRALIPHDGAAVHMELTVESESARARRMAVAQEMANAEFARVCSALRAVFSPGAPFNLYTFTEKQRIAEAIAGAPLEDGDWEDVSVLAMRGWK